MKRNVLIVGAGGVAHVAAHKFAQNNDLFGDIYIASRSIEACEAVLKSIKKKNNYKIPSKTIKAMTCDTLKC